MWLRGVPFVLSLPFGCAQKWADDAGVRMVVADVKDNGQRWSSYCGRTQARHVGAFAASRENALQRHRNGGPPSDTTDRGLRAEACRSNQHGVQHGAAGTKVLQSVAMTERQPSTIWQNGSFLHIRSRLP